LREHEHYSEMIKKGGAWWLHVQEWIAERDDDQAKFKELEPYLAKQKAELAAFEAMFRR
jgi:poly(3-hydroxyalkanoate) synthetase